jgi:ACT domain-containing protein
MNSNKETHENIIRTLSVRKELDFMVEQTRQKIGMSRSGFYKYAITKLLQELSVLSTTAHTRQLKQESGENPDEQ